MKRSTVYIAALAALLIASLFAFGEGENITAQEQGSTIGEDIMIKTTDADVPKIDREVPAGTKTATFALG